MNHEDYIALYKKYLAGEATPEEIGQLENYKDNFRLQDMEGDADAKIDDKDYALLENRILSRVRHTLQIGTVRRMSVRRWSVAAAILILFVAGAGALLLLSKSPAGPVVAKAPSPPVRQDVAPGANKAILTLSDGRKIALTDADDGTLGKEGNITISKARDGQLQYVVASSTSGTSGFMPSGPEATGLNTISTPKGGQYQVQLPDGTKVWLNATSSLTFPLSFTGSERLVELTGEAYFEVAKKVDKPFTVSFNHTQVQVLGTSFNIKAYPDDEETQTTLVEGAVKVKTGADASLLAPGQQAIDRNRGHLQIVTANIEEALAWKNGYFIFHNSSIQEIMKQASRWYDVDITYEGNLKEQTFGGRISKYKNISALLKNLELTGSVHFKVEGKKVTVIE